MRSAICLGLMTAAVLLVPAGAAQAGHWSPVVVQGLENLLHAKEGYTAPTISAWPVAGGITYGDTLADSALTGGTASVPGRFTFAAPATTPNAGNYVADVLFTPTDTANYSTVTGTVSVTVDPATPTVTSWPAASAITFGQSLAASSFTGGATSVPGTFAFTAPETVPGAEGSYTASVTFTPTDSANYETVQGTVSVTVNAAPVNYSWRDYIGIPILALVAVGIVSLAEGGDLGGPCFIATAAWGTPLAPEVDRLRAFRDSFLLTGVLGTAAVDVYYRVSPPIADAVAASPALAMMVRIVLIPVLVLVSMPLLVVAGLALVATLVVLRRTLRRRLAQRENVD